MKYDSIIPEGLITSKQCYESLDAMARDTFELSLQAIKQHNYTLADTLFKMSQIYSNASEQAFRQRVNARDKQSEKFCKKVIHGDMPLQAWLRKEIPF